jgi:hypothetical protein
MCQQDVPANSSQQYCYSINDKEGRTVCDGYDLNQVIGSYIEYMQELAIEDGEHYKWSEVITVNVIDENDDESTLTRTVHMDTRLDTYDHGRFDYESTRI